MTKNTQGLTETMQKDKIIVERYKHLRGVENDRNGARVEIKPLSVNSAWRGRRFKTPEYSKYERDLLFILPRIAMPEPPYQIYFKFGFSSASSDWDNCVKTTQDILSKKYKFNDKLIKRAVVEVEQVKKGYEYFEFKIDNLTK
jgi:predicted transcriptional regulator with HTH domain